MSQEEKYDEIMKEQEEFINNILKKKYCLSDESSRDNVYNRIENGIADHIPNGKLAPIMEAIRNQRITPAGSVLFGLGNDEVKCSLSNCYFIPIKSDSIEAIYECQKELAQTFKYRGGSGTDISILRPRESKVRNAALKSSGSVSFLPEFSSCVNTIGQNNRRGALIVTIDIRHPDVLDFIWCKSHPETVFGRDFITGRVPDISGANISVKITDDFIRAVENNEVWNFVFPDHNFEKYDDEWDGDFNKWVEKGYPIVEYEGINARELLNQIAESAWISGDPGVIFIDQIQKWSTGYFDENLKPTGVNPCSEQALAKYNNCLLSAQVIHKYVLNPYSNDAEFDMDTFLKDSRNGIIFLDALSDINIDKHPLKEQREADRYGKRLGQEFTGLADMWAMLGYTYGSSEALDFLNNILYFKAVAEIETSIELAKEKGPCEALKTKKARKEFIKQPYIRRIFDKMLRNKRKTIENNIIQYGLRNTAFNTVGPTGTLSIISDHCTSGIEPLYMLEYFRSTRVTNQQHKVIHYPLLKHVGKEILNLDKEKIKRKYNYVEAFELDYNTRIKTQAQVQKYTDSSVSSTINLPNDANVSDIYNIYLAGFYEGVKGLTIYREGSKDSSVLSTSSNEKSSNLDEIIDEETVKKHLDTVKEKIKGKHRAYRVVEHWKGIKVYVSISVDENERPFEVFVNLPYEAGLSDTNDENSYSTQLYLERTSTWTSVTRLVSLALRANIPLEKVTDQLKKSSPTMVDLPNILLRALKPFLGTSQEKVEEIKETKTGGNYCPSCKQNTVIVQSGCSICLECGDSKCG